MMSAKSASRVAVAIRTIPFFGLKPGNPTPFSIQSSSLHCIYGFPDITNLDDALTVFDQMLQMKPNPPVREYNKLFNIVLKMNHFSQVIFMFKELCLLDRPIDEFSMSTVVNCYCKLLEADLGFGVFAIAIKLGYPPNIVLISCLIKGLFSQGKVLQAADLFSKIIRYDLCHIDETIVSTVLDGLCKSGRVDDAVHLLRDLENADGALNTFGYTVVIHGLCKSDKVDDAMDLLSKMIPRGFQPDVVTYTSLIQGLCYFSRMDEAKKLLKQMIDDQLYPNVQTFTPLIDFYCKNGLIEDAENVLQIMEDWQVHPDVVTYNALMKGYCLMGQLDKASELLNFMVNKGLKPSVISYLIIIRGYCTHKQLDHAWKLFNEMPHKGLKPSVSVYNTIIHGLHSVGRCDEAYELHDEMKIIHPRWDS